MDEVEADLARELDEPREHGGVVGRAPVQGNLEAQPLGAVGVPLVEQRRVGVAVRVVEGLIEGLVDERPLVVGAQVDGDAARVLGHGGVHITSAVHAAAPDGLRASGLTGSRRAVARRGASRGACRGS